VASWVFRPQFNEGLFEPFPGPISDIRQMGISEGFALGCCHCRSWHLWRLLRRSYGQRWRGEGRGGEGERARIKREAWAARQGPQVKCNQSATIASLLLNGKSEDAGHTPETGKPPKSTLDVLAST
jgi:hypothetical protein